MKLPFYRAARRFAEGPLAHLTGFGLRLALIVLIGVCGAIGVALRLISNGAQHMSTGFDVEAGIRIAGGLAALVVMAYAFGIICWAFVVSVSRRPTPRHGQPSQHARYGADEQSQDGFCIVMFDTDDYVYGFLSVRAAQNWVEPLTVEEVDAIFDHEGRPLRIVPTKGGFALDADPDAVLSLQRRIEIAHGRGKLLDVDETLPTTRLTSLLVDRFLVGQRRWRRRRAHRSVEPWPEPDGSEFVARVNRAARGVPVGSAVKLWRVGDAGWHLTVSTPSPGGDGPGEFWDIWADSWEDVTGWFDSWSTSVPKSRPW